MIDTLWNTYDNVRDRLDEQCSKPFPADTGMPPAELEARAMEYLEAHKEEPRIRTRAAVYSFLLRNARIRVDAFDWFADHIDTGDVMWKIQQKWREEFNGAIPASKRENNPAGFPALDLSHTSPGWRNVLKYGIRGIRDRALDALPHAADAEAKEFYAAVATVYDSIRVYILRLAAEAERVGAVRVTECLKNIAERPPESFHEALQLAFLYTKAQEHEGEWVRTQGVFDRLYIDFYRRDLASGKLTREQAKELLRFYFDKFSSQHFGAGHNICFGGKNPDGSDSCNELTELAFEVFEERGNIDPKLSLRVHQNLPDQVLKNAARCVARGTNAIVFANDETAYPMFLKRGKRVEDLIDFVPVGCYEPAIMGRELCCSMSATVNLAKVIEYLFEEPEPPRTMKEATAKFQDLLRDTLDETLARTREWEKHWPDINPSPVMSGTMEGCFEKGRDVSNAGTLYNSSGVMCAGIGTVADTLAAIDHLVFEQKLCTWNELRDILAADWEGQEKLRLTALRRIPKWGNNLPAVDAIAAEIAAFTAGVINRTPNTRGGFFQMGCWSIDLSVTFGKQTRATPDGRKAGTPLSKNVGASIAADIRGVTALIHSAARLDHTEFPDGSVLDVMLHPSAVRGPDGAGLIAELVRTYFRLGGFFIHFNIFDAETLKKAQREPEKYRNLQIRVCGWNSRFIDLSPEMQETFIAQAEALR